MKGPMTCSYIMMVVFTSVPIIIALATLNADLPSLETEHIKVYPVANPQIAEYREVLPGFLYFGMVAPLLVLIVGWVGKTDISEEKYLFVNTLAVLAIISATAYVAAVAAPTPNEGCLTFSTTGSRIYCDSGKLTDPSCPMGLNTTNWGTLKNSMMAWVYTPASLEAPTYVDDKTAVYVPADGSSCTRRILRRTNSGRRTWYLCCTQPAETLTGSMALIFISEAPKTDPRPGSILASLIGASILGLVALVYSFSRRASTKKKESFTDELEIDSTTPQTVIQSVAITTTTQQHNPKNITEGKYASPSHNNVIELSSINVTNEHSRKTKKIKVTQEITIRKSLRRGQLGHGAFISCYNSVIAIGGVNAENVRTGSAVSYNIDDEAVESITVDCKNASTVRQFPCCVGFHDQVIVFGGNASIHDPRLLIFDVNTTLSGEMCLAEDTAANVMGTTPSNRQKAAMVEMRDQLLLFGGIEMGVKNADTIFDVLNDIHMLTKVEDHKWMWQEIDASGKQPEPRCNHACAVWNDQAMILFGGQDEDGSPMSDMWQLSAESFTWSPIENGSGRISVDQHDMACLGDRLIIVGSDRGVDLFDLNSQTWIEIECANQSMFSYAGQFGFAKISDSSICVFGGMQSNFRKQGHVLTLEESE